MKTFNVETQKWEDTTLDSFLGKLRSNDIPVCKELIQAEQEEPAKIKVLYAKLYVSSNIEKPYYGIEYHSLEDELNDDAIHCGFGSYNLELVKKWFMESFEFVYRESTPK